MLEHRPDSLVPAVHSGMGRTVEFLVANPWFQSLTTSDTLREVHGIFASHSL
jgi:hypothetical protein